MMSEKRFYCLVHNVNEDDECYEIVDEEDRYSFNFITDEGLASQVCHWLNVQQATINKQKCELLAKENEQLKSELNDLNINNQARIIGRLEKENEQLRRYVYHCPQICNIILAYLRKSETEDMKAVKDAMGDDKYFDEEIDTLRSWE